MSSPNKPLEGKTVIVTGAARGLGAAIAERLANDGANVIATDVIDQEDSAPDSVLFMHQDITDQNAWDEVVAKAKSEFGQLDALVNNAGIDIGVSIEESTAEDIEKMFRVNQLGTFLGMKAAIEPLKEAGGGSIVNIASCVSMRGVPAQFPYASSKWAVRGMTKNAALDLAQYNIRVNAVHPGPTDTAIIRSKPKETQQMLKDLIPLGRMGEPKDVANAVAFLLREESNFVSGADLEVDGAVFA